MAHPVLVKDGRLNFTDYYWGMVANSINAAKRHLYRGQPRFSDSRRVIWLVRSQICRVSCFMRFPSDAHADTCAHTPPRRLSHPNPVYPPRLGSAQLSSAPLLLFAEDLLVVGRKEKNIEGSKNSPSPCVSVCCSSSSSSSLVSWSFNVKSPSFTPVSPWSPSLPFVMSLGAQWHLRSLKTAGQRNSRRRRY